jgi:hypothetical protein
MEEVNKPAASIKFGDYFLKSFQEDLCHIDLL